MVPRPSSTEHRAASRHSWTPGMLRDDSVESERSPSISPLPSRRHVSLPTPSSAPVPSRSSLILHLPNPAIPSPPRPFCSPSSPLPARRSMLQLSGLDTPAWKEVFRSQAANTLQVPGPSSPASPLPALDVPETLVPAMPDVPQEEPTPAIPAVTRKKLGVALKEVAVQEQALPKIIQKKTITAMSEPVQEEPSLIWPDVPQEEPSPALPRNPQEEQPLALLEVPQKELSPAMPEVSQEKTSSVVLEDSKAEALLAKPEVSQEGLSYAMSDQPLALSEVSGEEQLVVAQEGPSATILEIPQGGLSAAIPKVSQEKLSTTLPAIAYEVPTIVITGVPEDRSPLMLEVSQEQIHIEEPPLVPQEEPLLAIPEVSHPRDDTNRWLAVPESFRIDDSDSHSSDSL